MNHAQHKSNNSALTADAIADVTGLPITRGHVRLRTPEKGIEYDMPTVSSYWRPTPAEREALAAGALVEVTLWGRTHSPILVRVDGAEE